ncbi:MAG: peptide-methionine (S)-S-oxide reductase [Flavobacteriales bacterium]|nr:peptide-methionine (S)-S-oxide reductase [Flavobacteriales bacterium]
MKILCLILIFFLNMVNTEQKNYAYFGGGCFWCIEAAFENLNGVINVTSGYSGGDESTANYKDVSSGTTKHAEICEIKYDPDIITFNTLLEVFFLAHDPTTLNRQGNDVGPHYRSIIFYCNKTQKQESENFIEKLEKLEIYNNIITELVPLQDFYPAEDYHQNYFTLNPNQAYCTFVINPKIKKLKNALKKYYLD